MKFTHGVWRHQPGITAHYAAQAYEVEPQRDGGLCVYASTKTIQNRGQTLKGPLLTVRLSAPMEGVIKVSIQHFSGSPAGDPSIPLMALPNVQSDVVVDDEKAIFRSGPLRAVIPKIGPWRLRFEDDEKTLTESGAKGIGYIKWGEKGVYLQECLNLGVGGLVYGLGERFTAFVRNGQVVENWNQDGGTGSEQAYKAVPFYLTNQGYGVLVNETGPVSFEVGSEKVSKVQFSIPGESLEYFVIHGPSPKSILEKLTRLTGRPALPPAWSFGLWLTTSFTTDYDEKTVTHFIDGMAERTLPLHVFHFDCFWMREFEWCNFQWDTKTFPEPEKMLRRLKAKGLRICVWINPYIGQKSPLFTEAKSAGYLLKRPNGDIWQTDQWQPGMGIVDFTNADACRWFSGYLRKLLEMGVDSFKTDFGERIPVDVVYADGSDPEKMHNLYAVLYNQVVFQLLEDVRGKGEAVLFARSSYASGQRFPVHWGGDCDSTFESMAESLRGGLSLGLCGFGFWSHDIGGFEGLPPAGLYKRWIAFGLLSSHSRLHGSTSYRVPWLFDEEACEVLRHFTELKCRLMPYLYQMAVVAHQNGVPVMRAMLLEFPEDPACETLDRQYMLGDSLLVAPVFSESGRVRYYLPKGRWTHLVSAETKAGPAWFDETFDDLNLPVYVREGSLVAMGRETTRPEYEYAAESIFHYYPSGQSQSVTCIVPDLTGHPALTLTARREGTTLTINSTPEHEGWNVRIFGLVLPESIQGGVVIETDPRSILLQKNSRSQALTLEMQTAKFPCA
jgi:alpha-D-xyloside xylohydrolase